MAGVRIVACDDAGLSWSSRHGIDSPRRARRIAFRCAVCVSLWLTSAAALAQTERVAGGPCEGCDAVFVGMPDEIASHARIGDASEPGEPLILTGTVYDPAGRPQPGVIVYAYHTNAEGKYPSARDVDDRNARRHGRLRAWARSDASGRYRFDTIRPGSYPGRRDPAHIHMHIIEPGCATYWIDDVLFTDDAKLTDKALQRMDRDRGGNGVVAPERQDGRWSVTRDVHLGMNVPGYVACGQT